MSIAVGAERSVRAARLPKEDHVSQDTDLQKAVLDELNWTPGIAAGHIGVTANDGVITLSGHVNNYADKQAAEAAARRVKGVKGLAEEIEVRLPFEPLRTDDEIAAAALERLSWNVSIPQDGITVTVRQGWVTLSGTVAHWYQRIAVQQDITPLMGVAGITNEITITPQVDGSRLSQDIKTALTRTWFLGPNDVQVTAIDGSVTLTGTVHALFESDLAERCAWAAPGATGVVNHIVVV